MLNEKKASGEEEEEEEVGGASVGGASGVTWSGPQTWQAQQVGSSGIKAFLRCHFRLQICASSLAPFFSLWGREVSNCFDFFVYWRFGVNWRKYLAGKDGILANRFHRWRLKFASSFLTSTCFLASSLFFPLIFALVDVLLFVYLFGSVYLTCLLLVCLIVCRKKTCFH